jgi:hypothetical protein
LIVLSGRLPGHGCLFALAVVPPAVVLDGRLEAAEERRLRPLQRRPHQQPLQCLDQRVRGQEAVVPDFRVDDSFNERKM